MCSPSISRQVARSLATKQPRRYPPRAFTPRAHFFPLALADGAGWRPSRRRVDDEIVPDLGSGGDNEDKYEEVGVGETKIQA